MPARMRVRSPFSQSRVCSVMSMRRAGELAAASPVCGVCAMRKRPTCVVPETTPRISGTSVVRSEMTPVATLDCSTNDADLRARPRRAPSAAPDGNRRSATAPDERDHDASRSPARRRSRRAPRSRRAARRSRSRASRSAGRSGLVHAPQVVAAVQEKRRRADVLGRLDEREQRRREERLLDAVGVEELVGERRERDDEQRRERSAGDLEQQRLAEEAPQTPPVLARDVAEAVLRERLLDREVEQRSGRSRRRRAPSRRRRSRRRPRTRAATIVPAMPQATAA